MVKELYFLLPADRSIASGYVRALCLKAFAPKDWEFHYIEGVKQSCSGRRQDRIGLYRHNLKVLWEISKKKSSSYVYFIKPSSSFVVFISRYLFGLRTFVDINDPIHLNVHLGRLSKLRAWLFFNISDGIVFESVEYRTFLGAKYYNKSIVVEDTPQFTRIYDRLESRARKVIWFGSAGTSYVLLDYIEYLRLFNSYGYPIILLGAAADLVNKLKDQRIDVENIPKYEHKDLVEKASDSLISFVPMPDIPDFALRGNLKAKFGMACGCITIASNIEMHRRLISDDVTGYLFDGEESLKYILEKIRSCEEKALRIAHQGNEFVANKYTVKNHAKEITEFFESRKW